MRASSSACRLTTPSFCISRLRSSVALYMSRSGAAAFTLSCSMLAWQVETLAWAAASCARCAWTCARISCWSSCAKGCPLLTRLLMSAKSFSTIPEAFDLTSTLVMG